MVLSSKTLAQVSFYLEEQFWRRKELEFGQLGSTKINREVTKVKYSNWSLMIFKLY